MDIKKTLNSINVKPRKEWGQNFLNNKEIAEKIINTFDIKKNIPIIEIGPGLGMLTEALISKIQKDDNHKQKLILVEKDLKLFKFLKTKFDQNPQIELYNLDILESDWVKNNLKLQYQVIGNLPYSIATAILKLCLIHRNNFVSLFFSFPKEIAEKIIATNGSKKYGFLSFFVQLFSDVKQKIIFDAQNFYPLPKVKSIFLEFIPKKKIITNDMEKILNFVQNCFKHKRKTLINNWKIIYNLDKKEITEINLFFQKNNFQEKIRAEMCTLNNFKAFFDYWEKKKKY